MKRACVTWKVNQINKMFENGNLVFDNVIQRNYVWNAVQQSGLIDSIIRNYPVSVIYTIKTNDKIKTANGVSNVFDCLDGKQRCTTLNRYLNNEFVLKGCEPFTAPDGAEVDLNGKYFKDLDKVWQDKITEYKMTLYYFTEITDEEIVEMMSRLNGGKPLSGTENARIKARNLTEIKNIAAHPVITNNLTATAIRNYVNEDIVIKTTLLMNGITNLTNANVRMAYETYSFVDETRDTLVKALDKMNEVITAITAGEYNKTTFKKIVAKTNFITILYTIATNIDKYTVNEFADTIYKFYNNPTENYVTASKAGTMRATNVSVRNEELANFVKVNVKELVTA